MALTAMSVCGQPSVLYLRRSQPSSRYQPARPSSWIRTAISASEYTRSLGSAMADLRRGRCPLYDPPTRRPFLFYIPDLRTAAGRRRRGRIAPNPLRGPPMSDGPTRLIESDEATSHDDYPTRPVRVDPRATPRAAPFTTTLSSRMAADPI